jgi:predicted GNAT family N-acyltransferase
MEEVSVGRVITTERGKGYGKRMMLEGIPHIKMIWEI